MWYLQWKHFENCQKMTWHFCICSLMITKTPSIIQYIINQEVSWLYLLLLRTMTPWRLRCMWTRWRTLAWTSWTWCSRPGGSRSSSCNSPGLWRMNAMCAHKLIQMTSMCVCLMKYPGQTLRELAKLLFWHPVSVFFSSFDAVIQVIKMNATAKCRKFYSTLALCLACSLQILRKHSIKSKYVGNKSFLVTMNPLKYSLTRR